MSSKNSFKHSVTIGAIWERGLSPPGPSEAHNFFFLNTQYGLPQGRLNTNNSPKNVSSVIEH